MTPKRRISIHYGGSEYAVSGRDAADVREEIEAGITSDGPAWLEVSLGRGRSTTAHLLLGAGMPIAVIEVNVDGAPAPREAVELPPEGTEAQSAS